MANKRSVFPIFKSKARVTKNSSEEQLQKQGVSQPTGNTEGDNT